MSVRLPKKSTGSGISRNAGTYLALVFLLAVAGGLISLVSLALPQVNGLLLVLAGFGGFVALHYFTWGRWLIRWNAQQLKEESLPPSPPPPPVDE